MKHSSYDQNLKCIIIFYYIGLIQRQNACILCLSSRIKLYGRWKNSLKPKQKIGTSLSMILNMTLTLTRNWHGLTLDLQYPRIYG